MIRSGIKWRRQTQKHFLKLCARSHNAVNTYKFVVIIDCNFSADIYVQKLL